MATTRSPASTDVESTFGWPAGIVQGRRYKLLLGPQGGGLGFFCTAVDFQADPVPTLTVEYVDRDAGPINEPKRSATRIKHVNLNNVLWWEEA